MSDIRMFEYSEILANRSKGDVGITAKLIAGLFRGSYKVLRKNP